MDERSERCCRFAALDFGTRQLQLVVTYAYGTVLRREGCAIASLRRQACSAFVEVGAGTERIGEGAHVSKPSAEHLFRTDQLFQCFLAAQIG